MPLELAEEWQKFEAMIGMRPKVFGKDIPEIRANVAKQRMGRPLPDPNSSTTLTIHDEKVDDFSARIYEPKESTQPTPLAMFFHGGGFCVGDLDGEDELVRFMADSIPMTMVSVDYRLAPESPWPASLDDCVAAARWSLDRYKNSDKVDASRLLLTGTSAGAQLALATAAKLVEADISVAGVVALAPLAVGEKAVPSHLKSKYVSMTENADGPVVDYTLLRQFMDANGHDDADPSFSVILSPTLAKFPPTYIATCGADTLRDDGVLLEEELERHKRAVKRDHYHGYPHVFWAMPGLKITEKFQANLIAGIKWELSL